MELAVRGPRKAVVATRQNNDAAAMHLTEGNGGGVELLLVADLLGFFMSISECSSIVECGDQPVDARRNYVKCFLLFEHVHAWMVLSA